jgi:peroxiredoxin
MPAKTELAEGAPAPEFDLQDDSGTPVRLADLKGKTVVL